MAYLPPIYVHHHKKTTALNKAQKEMDHLLRRGIYAGKTDLRYTTTFRLPVWAAEDPLTFFHASEVFEWQRGRFAYTLRGTLPRGLTESQFITLTADFVDQAFPRYAGFWVLHIPEASDGQPQPHAHICFSTRLLDDARRPKEQFFRRFNPEHPSWGGCEKDRATNKREWLPWLRSLWCQVCEDHLKLANVILPPSFPIVPEEVPLEDLTLMQRIARQAAAIRGKK